MTTIVYPDGSYLDKQMTPVSKSGTGVVNVYTWTIAAGVMKGNGDYITGYVSGFPSTTASGNIVSHQFAIDSTTLGAGPLTTTSLGLQQFGVWFFCMRKDASNILWGNYGERGNTNPQSVFANGTTGVVSQDSALGFVLKFQVNINNSDTFNYNTGIMRLYRRG